MFFTKCSQVVAPNKGLIASSGSKIEPLPGASNYQWKHSCVGKSCSDLLRSALHSALCASGLGGDPASEVSFSAASSCSERSATISVPGVVQVLSKITP